MDYHLHQINAEDIVEIKETGYQIQESQDFLNLIGSVPSSAYILRQEHLIESFFDLKTGLAGDILQKVSNYHLRLAIVGDFSKYPSQAFQAFIYESNRGGRVLFVRDLAEALRLLSSAES